MTKRIECTCNNCKYLRILHKQNERDTGKAAAFTSLVGVLAEIIGNDAEEPDKLLAKATKMLDNMVDDILIKRQRQNKPMSDTLKKTLDDLAAHKDAAANDELPPEVKAIVDAFTKMGAQVHIVKH